METKHAVQQARTALSMSRRIFATAATACYAGPCAELDLGGRKVDFHAWGAAHTRGDQIVFLPQGLILFAGDLAEERMFQIFPWSPPQDTASEVSIRPG